jgi:catechol 2,3-dioxygenase-like lactoylglutathione lyase family enzyme
MPIEVLDHVNIVTDRLDETRRFYVDVLGLEEGDRPPFSVAGHWLYANGRPLVHLQVGDATSASTQNALNHFAFRVSGFDDLLERLSLLDVPFAVSPIPGRRERQAFLADPNGVRIELGES